MTTSTAITHQAGPGRPITGHRRAMLIGHDRRWTLIVTPMIEPPRTKTPRGPQRRAVAR